MPGYYCSPDPCEDADCDAQGYCDCDTECCDDPHCSECNPDYDCDCEGCRPQTRETVWPVEVHYYSWKPSAVFWSTGGYSTTKLSGRFGNRETFLGCEIEVEVSQGADPYGLREAFYGNATLAERIYCKEDSSLNDGVELVSHPMTLAAWQELHSLGETDLYRRLGQSGCASEDTCGMHVHINRSSFRSPSHQARFAALFLRNRDYMEELAGRSCESYASFRTFPICRTIRTQDSYNCPRGAVNLGNTATIEIRMFASTCDPSRILANLETVHAAQAFTRSAVPQSDTVKPADRLTFCNFAAYVDQNASAYPHAANLPVLAQFRG